MPALAERPSCADSPAGAVRDPEGGPNPAAAAKNLDDSIRSGRL
jgi:hypothetical protein